MANTKPAPDADSAESSHDGRDGTPDADQNSTYQASGNAQHDFVNRAIAKALFVGLKPSVCEKLGDLIGKHLTQDERGSLLLAFTRACHPKVFLEIADTVARSLLSGAPLPAFGEQQDEAQNWASMASLPALWIQVHACLAEIKSRNHQGLNGSGGQ